MVTLAQDRDADTFGHALAAARRRAGLTQSELAGRMGTTQAAITRLETGQFLPSVGTLRRLARALNVTFMISEGDGLTIGETASSAPSLAELRSHREEILSLAAAEGASNLRVFGSVARSDAAPDSDIDLVVDFKPGYSLMNLSGLQVGLEELLGRRVHVTTLPDRPASPREQRVTERIRREAVPL